MTRNVKIFMICTVSIVALLILNIWNPKLENTGNMEYKNDRKTENEIQFSKPSGFYAENFMLEIHAPTEDIYYTLDGSEPDIESEKYMEPIEISDATLNENVYSKRMDTTTGFLQEMIQQYATNSNDPGYQVPNYNIDKCTVVRAVYYDEKGRPSDVATSTYFVGYGDKSGYDGMNIISITTDPDNLFDYDNGIYVTGKAFDTFVADGGLDVNVNSKSPWWHWWDGNYRQRGKSAERCAAIQIFNVDRDIVLTQDVGIRIQGGGSRGYITKSINIYARQEYNGNTRLHYDFWSTGYIPDAVTLTSCGDDWYSKIRDRLVAELSEDAGLDFSTMHFAPYVLFLNGEYWGFYYITEKYDEEFISNYYHVDSNNVVIVKNGLLEAGEESDMVMYYRMRQFLESTSMMEEENYRLVCDLFDMQSMIDYLAIEIYVSRYNDWKITSANTALWRVREEGDGEYEDGKWRWMLFDQNSGGLTSDLTDFDSIENTRETSLIFNNLCENERFRTALANRIIELGNGAFSADNVNKVISEYVRQLEEPMNVHMKRFWGTDNKMFHAEVNSVKDFFDFRFPEMVEILKKNFGDWDVDEKIE